MIPNILNSIFSKMLFSEHLFSFCRDKSGEANCMCSTARFKVCFTDTHWPQDLFDKVKPILRIMPTCYLPFPWLAHWWYKSDGSKSIDTLTEIEAVTANHTCNHGIIPLVSLGASTLIHVNVPVILPPYFCTITVNTCTYAPEIVKIKA